MVRATLHKIGQVAAGSVAETRNAARGARAACSPFGFEQEDALQKTRCFAAPPERSPWLDAATTRQLALFELARWSNSWREKWDAGRKVRETGDSIRKSRHHGRVVFRIAHVSDVHFFACHGESWGSFLNKRITGGMNLLASRSRKYNDASFEALVAAAKLAGAQHLVITGDLTNLSLRSEFEFAVKRLAACDLPLTVIPGNHDAYVKTRAGEPSFESWFAPWLGDPICDASYPRELQVGDVQLIMLSTAVVTGWFSAQGELGAQQLAQLETMLARRVPEGVHRVVLVHHPITPAYDGLRRGLRDAAALREVLAKFPVHLVLHGHEHTVLTNSIARADGVPLPVHGMSSGSALSHNPLHRAGFALYTFGQAGHVQRAVHQMIDGEIWENPELRWSNAATTNHVNAVPS